MKPYADYEYYAAVYGGALGQADFERHARRAAAYLDQITFGRAARVTDGPARARLRDACCAVIDECAREAQGGEVASETVGKWSRTYQASGRTAAGRRYDAAALYLAGTGLLYRGCGG